MEEEEPIIYLGSKELPSLKERMVIELQEELKKYAEISEEQRGLIATEAQNLPNFIYLNPKILAVTYAIDFALNYNPEPNNLFPLLRTYIIRMDLIDENSSRYPLYEESILRYLTLITVSRKPNV
jgi:hypothetical protein